ncbi:hypothetical protein D8B26_005446 [Coccidioides posadasii str. Silveira]|uniref:Uncharacterized protein n=1 Tax=Coccidioides posadasii (strain RMSCC 757 / Silveira) TaxID=443226 RepID=E9DJ25_COCPS|nr:conserved hypothetical protein [Coccidioides posadasii str. Silveira]QVM10793.1 hypothetical protein D8B26_005446 [Coccidioides posadasii str. Silveira]
MRDARLGGPSNSSAVKRQRSEERSDDEDDNQPSKKSRTGCDDSKNGINKYDVSSPSRSLKLTRASTTPNLTQKQLSSGMVLRRPAENSHSNPSSSNSTSQQSSFSTTHRTAAQSSRSSSAAPVPPKPIPTAASIPPNGNTDNNGCDSHTHSHPDVLSEARLQGLTDKDWLYILSRAQAYSGEKLRADNLVAKEREAHMRLEFLETHLAETKRERDKLIHQFASAFAASPGSSRAVDSHLKTERVLDELIEHAVEVKSIFDKLWMTSKVYIAQKVWKSAELEALALKGSTVLTKIDRIIKEQEARGKSTCGLFGC